MFPVLSQQSLCHTAQTVCYYDGNDPYDSRELPCIQHSNVPVLGAKCFMSLSTFNPHNGPTRQDWLPLLYTRKEHAESSRSPKLAREPRSVW